MLSSEVRDLKWNILEKVEEVETSGSPAALSLSNAFLSTYPPESEEAAGSVLKTSVESSK